MKNLHHITVRAIVPDTYRAFAEYFQRENVMYGYSISTSRLYVIEKYGENMHAPVNEKVLTERDNYTVRENLHMYTNDPYLMPFNLKIIA